MEDMSKRRRSLATKGKDTSCRAKPLVAGADICIEQVFRKSSKLNLYNIARKDQTNVSYSRGKEKEVWMWRKNV